MTISSLIMVAFGRRIVASGADDAGRRAERVEHGRPAALRADGRAADVRDRGHRRAHHGRPVRADVGWAKGLCFGLFHAVSAFNNAGFALFSDNLMGYRGDLTINLVITTLIIAGGLGFFVLSGVLRLRQRRPVGMSTHTRLVLTVTASLLAVARWPSWPSSGPIRRRSGRCGVGEKLLAAYFQAVTPRTAGFNTIDIGAMTTPALFLTIVLMFIGASPGGTGGGVKTTTFGVIGGRGLGDRARLGRDVIVFKRRLPQDLVARAFSLCADRVPRRSTSSPAPAARRGPATCCTPATRPRRRSARSAVDGAARQPAQSCRAFFGRGGQAAHHGHDVHGPRRSAHAGRRAGRRAPRPRASGIPEGKVMIG